MMKKNWVARPLSLSLAVVVLFCTLNGGSIISNVVSCGILQRDVVHCSMPASIDRARSLEGHQNRTSLFKFITIVVVIVFAIDNASSSSSMLAKFVLLLSCMCVCVCNDGSCSSFAVSSLIYGAFKGVVVRGGFPNGVQYRYPELGLKLCCRLVGGRYWLDGADG